MTDEQLKEYEELLKKLREYREIIWKERQFQLGKKILGL